MNATPKTHYQWSGTSPIVRVEAERMSDGKLSLRIYPGKDVSEGQLATLPKDLHRYGFNNEYATVDQGQNVLQVSGLRDRQVPQLLGLLASSGLVQGDPVTIRPGSDSSSMKDTMQDNALKLSGRVGLLGHGALFLRGALRGDRHQLWQAPLGASVPIILGACGNGQDAKDLDPLIEEMREYFYREGIPFPDATKDDHRRSLLETARHFIATHPTEVAGVIGTYAALKGVQSGWADRNFARMGAAGASMAGTGAMMLVPERENDDGKSPIAKLNYGLKNIGKAMLHPTQLPKALGDFISSGPIMFMGVLNLLDNVLYGAALWTEHTVHRDTKKNIHAEGAAQRYYEAKLTEIQKGTAVSEALRKGAPTEAVAFGDSLKATFEDYAMPYSQRLLKPDVHKAAVKDVKKLTEKLDFVTKNIEMATPKYFGNKVSPGAIALGLSAATLISWAAASSFAAISSKNATKKQEAQSLDRLYSTMAKLLIEVPTEQRQGTINLVGNYLSSKPEMHRMHLTSETLVSEINSRIGTMEHSPWIERTHHAAPASSAGVSMA